MLDPAIVRKFFFCILPISPTRKIFPWLDVDVATHTSGELVNYLNNFNGLQNGIGVGSICSANGEFNSSAKTCADGDRPRTVCHLGPLIYFLLILLFHCGFQLTTSCPLTVTG
jgi:hypothetical protein